MKAVRNASLHIHSDAMTNSCESRKGRATVHTNMQEQVIEDNHTRLELHLQREKWLEFKPPHGRVVLLLCIVVHILLCIRQTQLLQMDKYSQF